MDWVAHVSMLIAGVSKQASAVVPVVTPGVCHRRHDSHRVALFQFCLQRIVIRVGTPFKRAHVTEETGGVRAAEIASSSLYCPQAIPGPLAIAQPRSQS